MSGGPTVTVDGRVAGINVAKQTRGELVSFLVPVEYAVALIERARKNAPLTPADARAQITRQLTAWQSGLSRRSATRDSVPRLSGRIAPPRAPCRGSTAGRGPTPTRSQAPRAGRDDQLQLAHVTVHRRRPSDRPGRFHALARERRGSQRVPVRGLPVAADAARVAGQLGKKRLTQQRCHEDFVTFAANTDRPLLRAVWCARAYREFDGLYDVSVSAVTEDRDREALVSRLNMRGITYEMRSRSAAASWAQSNGPPAARKRPAPNDLGQILSRHRDVVARQRCEGAEIRIGRAYDNDVIVDDPYVAPRHLRIYPARMARSSPRISAAPTGCTPTTARNGSRAS